ncbi:regulatory protein RecX [Slackia piriformis]|uniref:regulatory protein RecX n=1 Tax=Slackia piriformis TaxID=626934 RepID=UPI0023F295F8|nr:regulatory protein RecX [Slackia piriformis]
MPIIDDAFLSTLVREPLAPAVPEEEEKAFSRISRLVASRERCACELEKRLMQDGFSERDAQSAIVRAVSCGMVDDLRYADILVRSRVSQGRGRAGIEEELNRCGIDPRRLAGWPDEYFGIDGVSEEDRAFDFLCRKPPRSKNAYAAACRKLVARGYSPDVVFAAARRYAKHEGVF